MKFKTLGVLTISCLSLHLVSFAQINFETKNIKFSINHGGEITQLLNTQTNINYLDKDSINYFVSLIYREEKHNPASAKFNSKNNTIIFSFHDSDVTVTVKFTKNKTHLTFEVINAAPMQMIDAIIWGPIFTTIHKTIGEIVGVVRGDDVAVGLLLLTSETLGGFYNKSATYVERGSLALPTKNGSSLQAYSINRDKNRIIDIGGLTNIPVNPLKGHTVVGSKIALFSCNEPQTLDIIEQVILSEKLPHPTINGAWTKKVFLTSPAYLISEFTENNIDTVITFAKRGGFFGIYHGNAFKTWGHFEINTNYFPNGIEGIKKCVQKAKTQNLFFGMHALTNFITPNDAYVNMQPDRRLANYGTAILKNNISITANEIEVSDKQFFNQGEFDNMHTIRIGNELIKFNTVTQTPPFKLIDCQRGAFNTKPTAHFTNDTVNKLADHPYKIFFPNFAMQTEMAKNLASVFNKTGANHLDFDGHEGTYASGQGDYAYCAFAEDFYKTLDHDFINGTSNSKPYYWYINTLCNWGEPWYGGFKQSMQEYRISNQRLLERNFLPNMLGWFLLTKNTTLQEMEWMLARAAGWDAGFAMVAQVKSVKENISGLQLLDAIKEWETARLSKAFSTEQKLLLKNGKEEFHLEKIADKEWKLYQFINTKPLLHQKFIKQPGEPTTSQMEFSLNSFAQKIKFSIEIKGIAGSIKNIRLLVNNYAEMLIPNEIKPNESIICDGTDFIRIYDEKGQQKAVLNITNKLPMLNVGTNKIIVDASFNGDEETPTIELIVKNLNNPVTITGKE